MSQQQLHEAAATAERRALGEAAQALQGEQQAVKQAHLLVHNKSYLYYITVQSVIILIFHWFVQNTCLHDEIDVFLISIRSWFGSACHLPPLHEDVCMQSQYELCMLSVSI